MMRSGFWVVFRRACQLLLRQPQDWLNPLIFFLMVVSLIPLALGPRPDLLQWVAGGIIWVAALLSVLLSMDSLFRADWRDGTLEQWVLSPVPLPLVVLAKVLAHWLATGALLALLSPLAAVGLNLPDAAVTVMAGTLMIGTLTLSLISAISAALTVRLNQGGVLVSLISLPLHIPVLVFATAAIQAATLGLPVTGYFALLGAFLVLALVLAPWAAAAALKLSMHEGT